MTPFPGMEGLDALMARFQPTPEQQAAARRDQLLTMGLGLLGTQKGYEMPALARSGLLAMQARDRSLNGAQEQAMQRMQAAQAAMQLQDRLAASRRDEQMRALSGQFARPGGGFDYAGYANALATIDPAKALQMQTALGKEQPKVKEVREGVIDPSSNKPVDVVLFDNGETKVMPFGTARKMQVVPLGGTSAIVDMKAAEPGMQLPHTQTPDSAASVAQQERNSQRVDARAREFNAVSREGVNANKALAQSNKQIEQVHTIRKEANALPDVQAFRAAVPMLNSAMTAPDTRAGDLDIIYAVGKALDPGSVVREGELNLVIKSGTLPQQLVGAASYVMGGGKLPPDQRAQLIAMLRNRVSQLKTAHDAALAPFEAQARANNLPADQLFIQPPPVNEAPASAAGNYDSLPSGAIYTAPDGTQRRKR